MKQIPLIGTLPTIAGKFLSLLVPAVAIAALVFVAITGIFKYQRLQVELHEKLELILQVHGEAVAVPLWHVNVEGVKSSIQSVLAHPEIVCAGVRQTQGPGDYEWPKDCFSRHAPEDRVKTPLAFRDQAVGELHLYFTRTPIMNALWREVSINGALFLLLTVVASTVAYWALQLIVDRPLSHLMASIKAAEGGGKRALINWSSSDEMGSVVSAYNGMIEQSDQHTEELVRAREAAEIAGASKTRFLANMSHELRTPLNAVIGITEMLREEAQDRQEDTEPFDRVTGAGRHLLGLIDNILDFSKIDADRIQLVKEDTSVQQLINDIDRTASALAKQNGNEFSSSFGQVPTVIHADPVRLRQVLINLIGNACKFTSNGQVRLRVDSVEDAKTPRIRFTVSDTGIGIEPDKIDGLFADFSQADHSVARQFGGTGLGLAISQRLCQMMGSEITVTSEAGKGASFSFVIPTSG